MRCRYVCTLPVAAGRHRCPHRNVNRIVVYGVTGWVSLLLYKNVSVCGYTMCCPMAISCGDLHVNWCRGVLQDSNEREPCKSHSFNSQLRWGPATHQLVVQNLEGPSFCFLNGGQLAASVCLWPSFSRLSPFGSLSRLSPIQCLALSASPGYSDQSVATRIWTIILEVGSSC